MNSMRRPVFNWKYGLLTIGLIVLAYMVMNFNSRIADLRRLSVQREMVAARLEGLEQTRTSLETQIADATSEAAVIEWAYQEGSLVRPGDNPVVPLAPAGGTPMPTPRPVIQRPIIANWQMWIWLFVDEIPGVSN